MRFRQQYFQLSANAIVPGFPTLSLKYLHNLKGEKNHYMGVTFLYFISGFLNELVIILHAKIMVVPRPPPPKRANKESHQSRLACAVFVVYNFNFFLDLREGYISVIPGVLMYLGCAESVQVKRFLTEQYMPENAKKIKSVN